jgi:hypothetical protein
MMLQPALRTPHEPLAGGTRCEERRPAGASGRAGIYSKPPSLRAFWMLPLCVAELQQRLRTADWASAIGAGKPGGGSQKKATTMSASALFHHHVLCRAQFKPTEDAPCLRSRRRRDLRSAS